MACSHAFSFYSHFFHTRYEIDEIHGFFTGERNHSIWPGSSHGWDEPGDTSEPGFGLQNCFERDLFDRTISLERTASPVFCSSAYMKIPLTPEVDEKFTFATICCVTRGLF
jgi:hypothetical protein